MTEALWGTRVSSGTVSNLNKKVYKHIEKWRKQPVEGTFAYIYLDGIVLKRSWGGEMKNVSVLAAIGVDQDGYRRILGVCEDEKEDKSGWRDFLKDLKSRGLSGVRLIVSDACLVLVESMVEVYPEADWQRCVVHFYRNVFSHVPRKTMREVAAILKAIHAQENRDAARRKATEVIANLREMKLRKAADERDPAAHESGWCIPGWQLRVDVGLGQTAEYLHDQLGYKKIYEYGFIERAGY